MAWLTLLRHTPLHIGYRAEFGRSTPNGTSVIKEIRLKIWFIASRLSRSLEVIGTHTDRSAVCDFLLMSHSNYGPISYRSKINGDFSRKSQNLPPLCILRPTEGGSLGSGYQRSGSKKLQWWSYRAEKDVWRSAVCIQTPTWQTHRRSDRRTPGDSKDRAYA